MNKRILLAVGRSLVLQAMRKILGVVTMRHVKAQVYINTGEKLTMLPDRKELLVEAKFEKQEERLVYRALHIEAMELAARQVMVGVFGVDVGVGVVIAIVVIVAHRLLLLFIGICCVVPVKRQDPDEPIDGLMSEAVSQLVEGGPTHIDYLAMDFACHKNWRAAMAKQGITSFERYKSAQVMVGVLGVGVGVIIVIVVIVIVICCVVPVSGDD